MPISRIGSQTGTTSLTIPTHQAGDLIVAFAFRDGSATPPSLPSGQGWLSPSNATRAGTSCSHRTAYKIAAGSSEATGTFTNASSLIVVVYRGVNLNQPIGTNTVNSGASTSIGFAATNPLNLDGSSWLLGFCGHRSADVSITTAPSGMSNVTSVSDATDECAAHDTNAGRTTNWSATNASVGGTSSGWTSHVLEIRGERRCMFNISQFRAGFAQVRAGLQVIEDQLVCAIAGAAGNYWNALAKGADVVLANSDKEASNPSETYQSVRSITSQSSGKWYAECLVNVTSADSNFGVVNVSANLSSYVGSDANGVSYYTDGFGASIAEGGSSISYGSDTAVTAGDVLGIALDIAAGKVYFSINNTWMNSADPAAGTGGYAHSVSGPFYLAGTPGVAAAVLTLRTGSSDFTYTPPSGFTAWG